MTALKTLFVVSMAIIVGGCATVTPVPVPVDSAPICAPISGRGYLVRAERHNGRPPWPIGKRSKVRLATCPASFRLAPLVWCWALRLPECVDVMSAPFSDGAPIPGALFHKAQHWLAMHWDSGGKILISCAAGQSRSVTMAIALLSRKEQLKFVDAVHEVIARVPGAYPHPFVLASAASHCGQPFRAEELQSVYASAAEQPPYPWSHQLVQEAAELGDS